MSDYNFRFSGIGRLYGLEAMDIFSKAHILVIGIGGVGSWAVEALARSGVGELTLMDLDDICTSNVNRQLHALDGAIGEFKVDEMAKRAKLINPEIKVNCINSFFSEKNADEILNGDFDYVLDCIDSFSDKCLLTAKCVEKKIPLVVVGAAGGRRDPFMMRHADLSDATNDQLLARMRKTLKRDFDFPRDGKFGVDAIYSIEKPVFPNEEGCIVTAHDKKQQLRLDCSSGFGTATHITGTFGFMAVSHLLSKLAKIK